MNEVLGPVLLQGLMKILRNNTEEYVELHRMLFYPYSLYTPGHLDDVLRGALATHIERVDPYFTEEVPVSTPCRNTVSCCHHGLLMQNYHFENLKSYTICIHIQFLPHTKYITKTN
jgi:hypothetical protein